MGPDTGQLDTDPQARPKLSEDSVTLDLPQQYELLGQISQGGMGSVYKARNRYTGSFFAIKVMTIDPAKEEKALQRFIVEAKAASSLKHPRICLVHDFGLTPSKLPYLVMEWIDGISLGKKVYRDGPIRANEAIRIFQQITAALIHAHDHKVIHRDLKPDNIMLTRDAAGSTEVHLVDFGIAKVLTDDDSDITQSLGLTSAGEVVGTPIFMSPEQAKASSRIDKRSDVYSLGCVMFFVLTGEPPFIGESVLDTMVKHLNEPPPEIPSSFAVPADLKKIVFKCLEKSVDDRYQSMDELAADLKKLTKGVSVRHGPLSGERKSTRKKLFGMVWFILGFLLMYGISIWVQNLLDSQKPNSSTAPALPAKGNGNGHK
jgi:eukaryotic-like serine/threonine-protein kinase